MAEVIYINGNIYTMDNENPQAAAVAVNHGRFTMVGSNEQVLELKNNSTKVVDLKGQTVIPGLNDSHMHLLGLGQALEQVDLVGLSSREELIDRCQRFMAENEELTWILGRGWNQAYFPDRKMPSRHDLDQISNARPILLRRACGHIAVANSCALELAGLLGGGFEQPVGGHVDVDPEGIPTGIIRERAIGLVSRHIPKATRNDYKRYIIKGAQLSASLGLTSVQTNDLNSINGMEDIIGAYQEALAEGSLALRVNHQVLLSRPEDIEKYLAIRDANPFPEHTVTYGPLKLMTDGSLGGRTALMHAPYSDNPATSGVSIMTQDEINTMFKIGHRHGLQLSAHAIGDLAIQKLLNAFRLVLSDEPVEDARPRIIHAQITNPHILEQMKELGVVCDIQPIFVPTDMYFVEERLGKARAMQTYPWKTMRDMGIAIAGGSDAPVESCNPIWGLAAAVTRQDLNDNPENGWRPEERLTPLAAIELFTKGSAFAERAEQDKGEIKAGMLADFIVLSQDITRIPAQEIKNTAVHATIINGHEVFSSSSAPQAVIS